MHPRKAYLGVLVLTLAVSSPPAMAAPLGTGFTYQGQLKSGGSPANGTYDLQFKLFDAAVGGVQIGPTIQLDNVSVTNGLFDVALDFGARFNGDARWLEVGVHPGAQPLGNPYTILAPRQALTAVPYALGVRLPFAETTATDSDVFNITTTGAGDGFQFNISNPASAGEALEGRTDGTGDSVQGINTGTGRAGLFQIINAANNSAALYATTNGTGPAMVADGKVGIGTTAPAESLHIVGGTDTAPPSGGFLVLGSVTSGNISIDNNEIMARNNGAISTLSLNFEGGDVQTGGDLLVSGSVGIGTTNPNHELVVQGNDPAMQIRDDTTDNSANAARLELLERSGGNFDGGAFFSWNGETNNLLIGTKLDGVNTNVLVIDRDTNRVGIGTQSPAAKLHIDGGTDTEPGSGGYLVTGSTSGLNISFDNNEIMARNNGATATLALNADGGNIALIQGGTGGVSIGTTTIPAGVLLAVDGKILCEEMEVQLSGDWPDYVFDDSYALMPLSQLEQAVEEHGHLPGIPSAADVAKDGVNVGKMQAQLLEKVEELTLYMIQMNKQMERVERENSELRARLAVLEGGR